MLRHVTDNLGVVEALGDPDGRDRGSRLGFADRGQLGAATPGRVYRRSRCERARTARPGPRPPSQVFAEMGGDEEFYIYLLPGTRSGRGRGRARRPLLAAGLLCRGVWRCAERRHPEHGTLRAGAAMLRDRFLSRCAAGLAHGATTSSSTRRSSSAPDSGAPLNRYRNVDRDWLDLQPWRRQPIAVPSLFIGGERDGPTMGPAGHRPLRPDPSWAFGAATFLRAAATGCSRSAPRRSTRFWSTG